MIKKGIILAGGSGTRLHPVTLGTSKQLAPIYNKPMIYYPLCVLMLAGIREILVINKPEEQDAFRRLLGDGARLGLHIAYAAQLRPAGIAEAFLIGREFIAEGGVALVLGDNIFYGHGLSAVLNDAAALTRGARIFAYAVDRPEAYGVVEFDSTGKPIGIEEKPALPRSRFAVTGLYFFDDRVADFAARLTPSERGELEITDLNRLYLDEGSLGVQILGRGFAWLDTGSPEAMLQAAQFVAAVEQRQGLMIACPEEIAYRQGWIGQSLLLESAEQLKQSAYGRYLKAIGEGAARR